MLPFLINRDPDSHKGDYGHALLIAGSYGKMGAAILAAKACLRSGVGLITVHVPRSGVVIMQTALPEAMLSVDDDDHIFTTLPDHLERYSAIAVGPGIGTDPRTQAALSQLLEKRTSNPSIFDIPLALDADALNIVALNSQLLSRISGAVITPHAGEYQRLFDKSRPQAMADRHGLVIVRKAHQTKIYAPGSRAVTNRTGNPAMATAGSGDVLTGVVLGLLAQGRAYQSRHADYKPSTVQQLAAMAVRMHGAAGDRALERRSQYSVIASDIIDSL